MERNRGHLHAERNFILQQGLPEPPAGGCHLRYSALMFQPRAIGAIVLLLILLRSPTAFFALAALLWWNALLPRWNPFDAFYNHVIVADTERHPLLPAPMPRRFSQGMAGVFALAIGASLLFGRQRIAVVLELALLAAVAALVFGRFCLGSFVYHLLRGQLNFARNTLPWARGERP